MLGQKHTTGEERAAEIVESLPQVEMSRIVSDLLQDPKAEATQWSATVFGRSVGPGTIGICLVRGTAESSSGHRDWSVVAKVLDLSATSDIHVSVSPRREFNAYTSGLLDSLRSDSASASRFRAARYYGLTKLAEDSVVLWLEDLSACPPPPWDVDGYGTVARHLGHFNATWLIDPPNPRPWFQEDGYLERFRPQLAKLHRVEQEKEDPHVSIIASDGVLKGLRWFAKHFADVLQFLRTADRPLSHVDSQPKNLFLSVRPDGQPETVAIDWATVGYAALGMDVGNLTASSLAWLEMTVDRAAELDRVVFSSYVEGLREIGWDGDVDLVRLAYLTTTTGRAAALLAFVVQSAADPSFKKSLENTIGHPAEEIANHWREAFEWQFPAFRNEVERTAII